MYSIPDCRGEMVERFKASVLKTDEGQPSGGSNPPLSAIFTLKFRDSSPFSPIQAQKKTPRRRGVPQKGNQGITF